MVPGETSCTLEDVYTDVFRKFGDHVYFTNFDERVKRAVERRIHIYNTVKQRWSYLAIVGIEPQDLTNKQ